MFLNYLENSNNFLHRQYVTANAFTVNLIFVCPCILNVVINYNQQDATALIYLFLQTLYMSQAIPPPIIRSTQLYIQLQVLSTNTAAWCYCA